MSLAIIFTCFNRKEKTLRCVESLINQNSIPTFDLYICDDGSTDGTVEAVKSIYPNARIIQGTGDLFWSRGMYEAMQAAQNKYDLYLMVNDDVEFMPTMWESMFTAYSDKKECGVVGCTLSKDTGKQSYGGCCFIENKKGDYVGPMLAPSSQEYVSVDLANWNCFLISREIIDKVGLIDKRYEHAMGDFDYSFRMKKAQYPIFLAKNFVGYCNNNSIKNTFKDSSLTRRERFQKLFAANGLPIKSWYYFTINYYKNGKIKNFINPYIKYFICIILRKDC